MTEIQTDKETHLIKVFSRYGITISLADIPEVMRLGADTFLLHKGISLPPKEMTDFYLILNEMR